MLMEIPKAYNPAETEDAIYALWEKSGFFNPDVCVKKKAVKKGAKPFSMVLPPPNVTGTLHMGHAAMLAIEDILVRYKRMKGYKTLWVPGTDHAAIATESKVEELLYKKEGKTRRDLGREAFLERARAFAKESHDTIVHQIKKLGASLDWSREAYTLDDKRGVAVRTAFTTMYDRGLIYRGERIVNWDPKLQTTVSDDEIEWKEEKTPLYYLQYGPFIIATARPETKFGDKYVVMHPKDPRYKAYAHGQVIEVPWIRGTVQATVIKDAAIDMSFGTGVMTITPWHDVADFEIAERHGLDKEQIIDRAGKLLSIAGEYAGTHIAKARPLIVEKFRESGLLVRVDEEYVHRVALNSRGGGRIEPQIMRQWFVNVTKSFLMPGEGINGIAKGTRVTLKELMLHAVRSKQIAILPKRFEKTYYRWIENLRDWCVSRQIWFGHQIPVYYCKQSTNFVVSVERPTKCPFCGECEMEQDSDTLDTWFSSGLWTFSTLQWPLKTKDLATYHPTNVLETGYDILFFWVARMVLMSTCLLSQIPFRTVYLHGMVRDEQGRKMSKSLGNIVNPLDMIAKYGADATRLSLVIGAAPGNDIKLSEDNVRGYRNFANKLWNISRFVGMNTADYSPRKNPGLSPTDARILKIFRALGARAQKDIETFRLSKAAETLYHYAWHTFADTIIEESKPLLDNQKTRASRQELLRVILQELIKLLHPFMPFVTESIYQILPVPKKKHTIMIERI